jgi:hypothetical protein
MEKCKECGSEHDPASINIPQPIPDGMCAFCGTQLSADQIQRLIEQNQQNTQGV